MDDHYHRAARDGRLDLLKEAYKRDLNQRDEDGMTPTLWAAYYGHLEALKVCCKRGGDPDKCDYTGNTSLHLTAQNGHFVCLSFLVKFGVNLFQLDNDYNSALAIAGNRGHHNCVKYLDDVLNKQRASDPKKVRKKEESAKKEADERIKKYGKRQQEKERKMQKYQQSEEKKRTSTVNNSTVSVRKTNTVSNANYSKTFQSSQPLSVFSQNKVSDTNKDFIVSEKGRRISHTINGVLSQQVANVMYREKEGISSSNKPQANKRAPLQGLFPGDEEREEEEEEVRPHFGTITLRNNFNSASAWYSALQIDNNDDTDQTEESIMPSASKPVLKQSSDNGRASLSVEDESSDEEENDPLETFLDSLKLSAYLELFVEEKVDMESLELCSMEDLKDLGIPFGPRKKILEGLKLRKQESEMELTTL